MRRSHFVGGLVLSPAFASAAGVGADAAPVCATVATSPKLSTTTFATGCSWCGETAFEGRPGVRS